MSGIALDELERRQSRRVMAEKAILQMKGASLMSEDAEKTYNEKRKELKKEYRDTLLMLTSDVSRLLYALKEVCRKTGNDPGVEYDHAVKAIPVASEVQTVLDENAAREAEKAAKQAKDVPGQQKLFVAKGKGKVKDDGSEAEPATECVTKPLDESIDPSEPAAPEPSEDDPFSSDEPESTEPQPESTELEEQGTEQDTEGTESAEIPSKLEDQVAAEEARFEVEQGKSTTEDSSFEDSSETGEEASQQEPTESPLRLLPPDKGRKKSKAAVRR